MKLKRVAIIGIKGYPYVYGGYETLIKSIAERIKLQQTDVTIYCHRSLFADKPKSVNGIHLKYIPALESKSLSQLTHSLLSTLHACFCRYDAILYVNVANAPFGWLPRLFGTKTLINVDGMEWLRPKWKGLGSLYYTWCARMVKYTFNTVITDAEEMRKTYATQFNTSSVMIPYGAEKSSGTNTDILNQLNVLPHKYYLVVGRMIPDNNLNFIIEEYKRSGSDMPLVVVGDDIFKSDYAKKIHASTTDLENIKFAGYVEDYNALTTLYEQCFAYIHGHEYGGTNPTLVLAMQSSCLILALNSRFNKEVLNNGENGLFFNKRTSSLTKLMEKAASADSQTALEEMKKKGPWRVENMYNWDKIANQYLNILAN
jgi:glycosyltransferase involved in cell wall biosynthesis